MKKTNKLFSIFFIGLFVFLGINFTENTKSTKNLDNQPQTKKQVKSKKNTIYFLQPDEAFNPNDFAFDEYWNQTKIIENNNPNEKLGEELFVIKAIEETEDGFYKIDLYLYYQYIKYSLFFYFYIVVFINNTLNFLLWFI